MTLPGLIVLFIFNYMPMYGILIAFKNYSARKGIWASEWIGFKHFIAFFNNPLSFRLITNTLLLGIYTLLWSFPAPIILALLFNELKHVFFKRVVQTISYFPHFISVIIICGMLKEFASRTGLFNQIRALFGLDPIMFLLEPAYFRTIFISSGIWAGIGFGSILYLAALANADPTLYDVAEIDGAGRFQKVIHISWQAIKPTTIIMLIFSLGGILGSDVQKIILLYSPDTYQVADVIGSYTYREGLMGARFEYGTAVSLFMSVISFLILFAANMISRKVSETSLW